MGNRSSSRSKRNAEGFVGKKTAILNGTHSAQNNDRSSIRTKADEIVDQRPSLNLRMYRSFSQRNQSDGENKRPDIRLHRRSFIVGGHASAVDGGPRGLAAANAGNTPNNWATRTLPRSFGRSRSSASTVVVRENSEVSPRDRQVAATTPRSRPTSVYSAVKTRNKMRPSSLAVNDDDFVEFLDCESIQLRTAAFHRRFVEHFLTLYSSLPSSVQTSALSVAVRRRSSRPINHAETAPSPPDVVISLHQYLDTAASCADVPLQLPASEYALTVSPAQFDLMRRARVDGCADPAALARRIVADVAAEAATELSRAFEYQIVLLGDEEGLAARLGAQRAAERAMDYLKTSSRHVDVNSLLRGVVEGRPAVVPATVSAIIGRRSELHWNVDDMFLRPGLRRERLLVVGGVHVLGGYGTAWRFYASADGTDATLYGYRGQLLARDFHSEWLRGGRQPSYLLDVDEETSYDVEVPWRTDDFHRSYRPYRRLVGCAVMASYAALSDEEKSSVSLAEFIQRLQGDAFRRDDVEPVFRPLAPSFCGEESTVSVSNPNPNFGANPDFTPAISREFCGEQSASGSNSMPENDFPAHDQSRTSATEDCREEFVLTSSSTLKNNSPAHGRTPSEQAGAEYLNRSLSYDGSCGRLRVAGTTSMNTSELNAGRNIIQTDQPVVCSTTAKRRPPPPAVKPKPSVELRRQLSTNVNNIQTMTSLPVAQRQSSTPVDGSDSTPEVTVGFPTLDELFGRELAAIRRSSTLLSGSADTNSHPPSTLFPQNTGSTKMTSSAATNDVKADDCSSQRATMLLTSDI